MPELHTEIIKIKKLRKDGSINDKLVQRIAGSIRDGALVMMPVDCIYGIIGRADQSGIKRLSEAINSSGNDMIRLISSFRMLDELADISKLEYDFLHRIWPGEVNVIMRGRGAIAGSLNGTRTVRFPKYKFMQDIIDSVNMPLVFAKAFDKNRNLIYKKAQLCREFDGRGELLVLIDEFCKKHPASTVIDITAGDLKIIAEGKVPADEIKSLYFLGKDDDLTY